MKRRCFFDLFFINPFEKVILLKRGLYDDIFLSRQQVLEHSLRPLFPGPTYLDDEQKGDQIQYFSQWFLLEDLKKNTNG